MKKTAPKGHNQKNKKGNGYTKTQTERKQKCAINPSTVQNRETNGGKAVDTTVQSKKKSTGVKVMNKGVGSTSGNRTLAKNTCHKSGIGTGRPKKATKHSPPPKTASTIKGCRDKHLRRNKRNVTESEEEEDLLSTTGSSEEVTAEEISDEEEEERDSRKESPEGDSSEEGTEFIGVRRNSDKTATKGSFGESKCSRSSELDRLESSIEEDTRDDKSSAGLKDKAQDKDISQEDASERLTGCSTRRRYMQPLCTTKPAKEPKYKMFKRSKAEKQAEKDEKRKVKAEKQRLEKEAKQKAKEDKKNKKKPLKAEKLASVTKEIPSTDSSRGKHHKTNEKNKSTKPTKNLEKDFCENDSISEVSREEDSENESALTKAIKGQNRFMHLKEKGKDLRNILAKPEKEIPEGEPLVLESNKVRQRLIAQRKGANTYNRVSGWIQKNVTQKFNLRKKISAWTKAMGISRWLSFKVIKQNRSSEKSKRGIVKHRIPLRVASKTSLVSKNKMAKEKAGEGGGAVVPGGEKDTEAKYAVVLPRMNELGKTKTAETSQASPLPSAPSIMTDSPGDSNSTESRPPKPGARLVLPVKPDLSLLKSIKTSLPVDLPRTGLSQRTCCSTQRPEGLLKTRESNRKPAIENYNGVSILEAARGKLDPSQINQTKLFLFGGTIEPTQTRGPKPERDAAAGMTRSNSQPFLNGDAGNGVPGTEPICDEEADREVAQLMCEGGKYGLNQPGMHWAGNPQMSGDPQVRSIIFLLCNTFFMQSSL